jgi:hypothetical protein
LRSKITKPWDFLQINVRWPCRSRVHTNETPPAGSYPRNQRRSCVGGLLQRPKAGGGTSETGQPLETDSEG